MTTPEWYYTVMEWVVPDPIPLNVRFFLSVPWRHRFLSAEVPDGADHLVIRGLADTTTELGDFPLRVSTVGDVFGELTPQNYLGTVILPDKDETRALVIEMLAPFEGIPQNET